MWHWYVSPRIGLKGFSMSKKSKELVKPKIMHCLNLSIGSLDLAAVSKNSGAFPREEQNLDKFESV